MRKIGITKEAAERIVKYGSQESPKNRQCVKKPISGRRLTGHLTGTIRSGEVGYYFVGVGAKEYKCLAPLLRSGETLEIGLAVIIQKNTSGRWDIIAAQCDE